MASAGTPGGSRVGGRVITPQGVLPFLLAVPPAVVAVLALVSGQTGRFGLAAAVTALFFLAAWLIRRGLRSAGTTRPFPGRLLGTVVLACATFGAARYLALHDFIISLIFGAGALAGTVLAYGSELMPTRAEGLSADKAAAQEMAAEARAKLQRLARARYQIQGAPEVAGKIDGVKAWIEKILGLIEEDPRDLRRARKFLVVYVEGAAEVAEKYVALQKKGQAEAFKPRLEELLDEMEQVSAEQHQKLLQNDTLDLDVQLEVLSERLKKEGVA